jgi:putative sterol carrier protein
MRAAELRKQNVKALRAYLDKLKLQQCFLYIESGKVYSEDSWEGTDCIKQGEYQKLIEITSGLEPLVAAIEKDLRVAEEIRSARALKKWCDR